MLYGIPLLILNLLSVPMSFLFLGDLLLWLLHDHSSKLFSLMLLGFRYLASSMPLICLVGVAIGVGVIFAFLVLSMSSNPSISNSLVSWAFIGFSLVEVSGFIGLVYSFLILYAFFIGFFSNFDCQKRFAHRMFESVPKSFKLLSRMLLLLIGFRVLVSLLW